MMMKKCDFDFDFDAFVELPAIKAMQETTEEHEHPRSGKYARNILKGVYT